MIDVNELTEEQQATLLEQLEKKKKDAAAKLENDRKEYKRLVTQAVADVRVKLQNMSSMLSDTKADVYSSFSALIGIKKDLYGLKEGQRSHSFSDDDGNTIEIGYRITDQWDDTLQAGIEKIKDYVQGLARDSETGKLVAMVNNLLKKDAKGNLKANRVLDLQNLAEEIAAPEFTEGVEIIRKAYKPLRSAYFVEATYKDVQGKKHNVPLSLTAVDFPSKFDLNACEL